MKRLFTTLFATTFALASVGCGGTTENTNKPNANTSTPTATPTVATNTNQNNANLTNANVANANVKQAEVVPTFTDANTALTEGNKFFDANENEKAIDAYKQAVKLNPDLADAHFKLGVVYALVEREKDSEVQEVKPDVTPTPKIPKAKTSKKGSSVIIPTKPSEKAFAEAIKAYKKILAKNPKDDVAQFNLGRSYNKLNEDKEAEKSLRQAVKLKPDDAEYQTELGAIMIKFAKYDEAIGILKRALKLDESNSQAQDLLEKATAGKKRQEFGIPKDKLKQ
jgi:tetratricopeptide (TPR) repeat protein